MPKVSTKVDLCAGHDACAPRSFSSSTKNVLAEGILVTRETDSFKTHGCPAHAPHGATVTRGFGTVLVNGLPVAYVGASVSCPSLVVGTGRSSVLVGENRGAGGAAPSARRREGGEGAHARAGSETSRTGGATSSVNGTKSSSVQNPYEGECRGRPHYEQTSSTTCVLASIRMVVNGRGRRQYSEQDIEDIASDLELWGPPGNNSSATPNANGLVSYGRVFHPFGGTYNQAVPFILDELGVDSYNVPGESYSSVDPQQAQKMTDFINRVTNNGTTPALFSRGGHTMVLDGIDANGNVMVRDPLGGAAGCRLIPVSSFFVSPTPVTVLGNPPPGTPPPDYIAKPI